MTIKLYSWSKLSK